MLTNRCLWNLDHLISTQVLHALELRDLNPVDTSWSAFNYYIAHGLTLLPEYNYSASASIIFWLPSSSLSYNYILSLLWRC